MLHMTLPADISDVTYVVVHLPGDQAVNSVGFTRSSFGSACPASGGYLGYLTYDDESSDPTAVPLKLKPWWYIPPRNACMGDVAAKVYPAMIEEFENALQTTLVDDAR